MVVVVVVKPRGRTKKRYSVIAVRNREREAFLRTLGILLYNRYELKLPEDGRRDSCQETWVVWKTTT